MNLAAERAASFRRRGIAPLPDETPTVSLAEIASRLGLSLHSIYHYVRTKRLPVVRRLARTRWCWGVPVDAAETFIRRHQAGEIGNRANRGKVGRTWTL